MTRKKFCAECERRTDVERRTVSEDFEIRGETFTVCGEANVCTRCGSPFGDELYDALLASAYDLYREKKKLVAPDRIRVLRERYGLSQVLFAKVLGIGEATLQRYERGSLPSLPMNALIQRAGKPSGFLSLLEEAEERGRLSSEEYRKVRDAIARAEEDCPEAGEAETLVWLEEGFARRQKGNPSPENGLKCFDPGKFKGLAAAIMDGAGEMPVTKLFKLLFYADFYHFREHGRSISGLKYARFPYGPVPGGKGYDLIPMIFEESGVARVREEELAEGGIARYLSRGEWVAEVRLSRDEAETVRQICERLGKLSARELSELSHREKGYRETADWQWVPYTFAAELKAC